MFLPEFYLEVKDWKSCKNKVADHLSCAKSNKEKLGEINIDETFSNELIMSLLRTVESWYVVYANYVVSDFLPDNINHYQNKGLLLDMKKYYWDEAYLLRECADIVIYRCVIESKMWAILEACHSLLFYGHNGGVRMIVKVLQIGFYGLLAINILTTLVKTCTQFQIQGRIYNKLEIPLKPILKVELFDVWGIKFIGPFLSLFCYKYISVADNYVSK